jgi:hypothetical protein
VPLKADHSRLLRQLLLWAGTSLVLLGVVVLAFGGYGVVRTPRDHEPESYLAVGTAGLALTVVGGFLGVGSWLARISADQREVSRRLASILLALGDVTAHNQPREGAALLVACGDGVTMHRRDCTLVVHRTDLRAVGEDTAGLVACRVCRP